MRSRTPRARACAHTHGGAAAAGTAAPFAAPSAAQATLSTSSAAARRAIGPGVVVGIRRGHVGNVGRRGAAVCQHPAGAAPGSPSSRRPAVVVGEVAVVPDGAATADDLGAALVGTRAADGWQRVLTNQWLGSGARSASSSSAPPHRPLPPPPLAARRVPRSRGAPRGRARARTGAGGRARRRPRRRCARALSPHAS